MILNVKEVILSVVKYKNISQIKNNSRAIGIDAENIALNYLLEQGLKLLHRNFYSRFGEIDLIMQDKKDIVFIEIKMRASSYENAVESITPAKQKKLTLTAKYYFLKHHRSEPCCRFDALLLEGFSKITWLKNIMI